MRSEFRSIQIMSRFVSEVVNAGDPLNVYAWALELVQDEVRHTELCAAVCHYLGQAALLPDPVALLERPEFIALPYPERALASAISMLGTNEVISLGFIEDLAARCTDPAIAGVLRETVADESSHGELGVAYIEKSLARFDGNSWPRWRDLVRKALAPHEAFAERALATLPPEALALELWPEPELAALGLLSPQRQALLYLRTRDRVLGPRLRALDLL